MLMITLADNRRIAVRPSGTEPKIKYYMFAAEPLSDGKTISADELEATKKRVTDSLDRLWKELKAMPPPGLPPDFALTLRREALLVLTRA